MARRFIVIKLLSVFFLLAALSPAELWARDARLAEMAASNTGDNLLVFLRVEGAFTEKMEQAVLNGIPTSFSFIIILEQITPLFLPNRTIAEKKVSHNIKYENLKNRFTVRRSWQDGRRLTTESFEEARKWMSEIKSLPVAPIRKIEKGKRYRIRARAELDKVELPFYLDYIFFFVSMWDFKTDWHSIEFVY